MTTNNDLTAQDLTSTLTLLYNLDDALMIALEAFVRKTFCALNIERFVANPATLFKLLEDGVYDDLGGFSYAQDWEIDYDTGDFTHKHDADRDSTCLFWLVNGEQVPYTLFEDIEDSNHVFNTKDGYLCGGDE